MLVQVLRFADDIAMLAYSEENLKRLLRELREVAAQLRRDTKTGL